MNAARRGYRPVRRRTVLLAATAAALTGCTSPPTAQQYLTGALQVMDAGLFAGTAGWASARRDAVREGAGTTTAAQTHPVLERAVLAAGGVFSRFVRPADVRAAAERFARGADFDLPTVTVDRGVGTVVLPAFDSVDPEAVARYVDAGAHTIVAAVPDTPYGWVVDVQDTVGDGWGPLLAAVSPLLSDGLVARFRDRDGAEVVADRLLVRGTEVLQGGRVHSLARTIAVAKPQQRPVAVLQGPGTAGAAELLVIAFHGQPGATVLGAPSRGLSTGTRTTTLSDGAQVVLATSVQGDRDGTWFGGSIPPDQPGLTSAAGVEARQDAADWLYRRGTQAWTR